MKLKLTLFIFIILLSSVTINAQRWSQRKYELYYGIGISNFMGDVAAPRNSSKLMWAQFFNTMGPTINTGLRYHYKGKSYFRGGLYLAQIYAEDPINNSKYYYRDGLKFNSFAIELSAKYEYMIFQERTRKTVYRQLGENKLKNFTVPTYLFIGIGGMVNFGTLSQSVELDKVSESYTNFAPVIPIGLGVKLRVTRNTYMNIEFSQQFTLSDGIDNCKGSESSYYGDYYDQYQFLSVNVIHKLKSTKKGLPKLSRR